MTARREPETARIHAVSHDGRGIAAIDGKKIFVPGALAGEEVRLQRRKLRRNFDEADLLEVLEPSPDRITPRCAVFPVCGGCSLQHVPDAQQREIKQRALEDNFERIAGTVPERWLPPVFDAEGPWRYRRRARLAVKDVPAKGRVLVGFRERHLPFVTDMRRCEVLAPPLDGLIGDLSELIGRLHVRNRVPQVEVAVGDNAVELVFRVLAEPSADDRAELMRFAARHELRVALQPGGLDSIRALYPETPSEPLYYELPEFGVRMQFEPTDFVQVNGPVNRLMVNFALDLLQPEPSERVLDLYCGIGNFSLPLARHAHFVLGIEGEERMVTRAGRNAAANGIDRCAFQTSDLEALDGREGWVQERWDKVLLDPARSGAAGVIRHMRALGPARIVYVSCHPGTLARDTRVLVREQGYRLEAAGMIDMFPHTAHAEAIAVFSKM
ncbi:MAG: 23S rRNA (uracil(1939)-C(5))-methyltransferase RlmD [Woeseiaceae bacterium]